MFSYAAYHYEVPVYARATAMGTGVEPVQVHA